MNLAGNCPPPRCASLRVLRDQRGEVIDRALVLWFPGPSSATGEDMAEFHLHGGKAVIAAALAGLSEHGSRQAEPGEFTRRALRSGRLNLEGVEGLSDLLAAETEYQRREALRRADGALGRRLAAWSVDLLAIAAQLEAAIDYDDDLDQAPPNPASEITQLLGEIDDALSCVCAERLRDGLRVAIVGPVNAGKSSLFNALLGCEAAIVSSIAGTTRDLIERPVILDGIPFVLIDTAGLRDSGDEIEQIGIRRAEAARRGADIVIDLASNVVGTDDIAVSAKVDIEPARTHGIALSSLTGEGIGALVASLVAKARMLLPREDDVALSRRYREGLAIVRVELGNALGTHDMIISAEHVRLAREAMDNLTGETGFEHMLDMLFSRFCVGK